MRVLAWVGGVLLSLALIAGIVIGGWQLGWWLKTQTVNRNAHLYIHSFGAQVGHVQDIQNDMDGINNIKVELTQVAVASDTYSALKGQQRALTQDACNYIAMVNVDNLPTNVQQFAASNC